MPLLQAHCLNCTDRPSFWLQARLAGLDASAAGVAGAAAAEQALLVGRLCTALAWDSRYLGVLLGPPEHWRQAAAAGEGVDSQGDSTQRQVGKQ